MSGRKKIYDLAARRQNYAGTVLEDQLIFHLRDLHCTMRALYEGKSSWKRVLIILDKTGPITQKELTERLAIQPASVSDVLIKMEDMGYISRSPSAEDQRTANVSLTPEGQRQAREAVAQKTQRHREMFQCLTEEEKLSLLSLLEKVNADWETRYRGAGQPRDGDPQGGK